MQDHSVSRMCHNYCCLSLVVHLQSQTIIVANNYYSHSYGTRQAYLMCVPLTLCFIVY